MPIISPAFRRKAGALIQDLWHGRRQTRAQRLGAMPLRDPSVSTLFGYMDTRTGVAVTEWTALTYSAVWAATRILAESESTLPLLLYQRQAKGRLRADKHIAYNLVHDQPNSEMTPTVFRETLMAHVLLWGNGYAEIERNNLGQPINLWPITPNRCIADRDKSGKIGYIVRKQDGGASYIKAEDMLHIPGLGFDGVMGYSVVTMARECIGLGLATEAFGATFFGNGTMPGGIIEHPGRLTEQASRNFRESWQMLHQGVDRAHRIAMLEEGAKWRQISVSPEDSQFLATRQFNTIEIARWFNIPPHLLRDLTNATYSNIEQQGIDFVTYSLRPWLIRVEQELNRKLLTPEERSTYYFEHLVDALLRGDTQTRFSTYATARQWGWLNIDEIREKENLNPLPNGAGQVYLSPANMLPADMVGKMPPSGGGMGGDSKTQPAGDVSGNPTGPQTPLLTRAYRSGKDPHRSEEDALALLKTIPDSKVKGQINLLMPVADQFKYRPAANDLSNLPKKWVRISKLLATQQRAKRDHLVDYIKDPYKDQRPDKIAQSTAGTGDIQMPSGLPGDYPYVVKHDGDLCVIDGHHRITSYQLLGIDRVKVYYYKDKQ